MTCYRPGQHCRINQAITSVQAKPDASAMCTSEALYGETLEVLSVEGAWCRIRLLKDDYEGFLPSAHLDGIDTAHTATTHRVWHRSTLLFSQPDFKSQVRHRIPFGSELSMSEENGTPFSRTACGHYAWIAHYLPLTARYPGPPLELAHSVFLGTPYRWGGRSPEGIDCSGLVQALAHSQGISIPRDSGDQEAYLSVDVDATDYQAQDIAYWPGHTGILVSPTEILHATAHSLSTVVEPLQAVIDRAGPLSSVKRLF